MHTERAHTAARLHAQRDTVCVCLYRARTHMAPQTLTHATARSTTKRPAMRERAAKSVPRATTPRERAG